MLAIAGAAALEASMVAFRRRDLTGT